MFSITNSYAKYIEKFNISYKTKIAEPIFIIENDEKIVIDNLENTDSESYYFTIKNYSNEKINQIKFFYQFEFQDIDEKINYQLWNLSENEKIEIEDGKTKYFPVDFNKKETKYVVIVDILNSEISNNVSIKLKINTKF